MFRWPAGFERVPREAWTEAPVASLAQKYDAVGRHGWYANLDETVSDLASRLAPGSILVDYSGGTGLLAERVLARVEERAVGIVEVDSSPKFLAMALQKLRSEPRVAFRLIEYQMQRRRLAPLDEVLAGPLASRGVEALVSANAVHLYRDLEETFASWARVLRPGAHVHVQSGNVRNPGAPAGSWILDDTVRAVDAAAREIVRSEGHFARHRPILEDAERLAAHEAFQDRVFVPPRPLSFYLEALRRAGFRLGRVWTRPIAAEADEWHQFLVTYSDAVLGWVGGHEKVEGRPASKVDLEDRWALMRLGLGVVLTGKPSFEATWTYVSCTRD